ncbi:hypothetical protein SBRCBS47491_008628 [Sporothrix bragantina]|uniref:Clr5 domain-containing protein n=1 Tax=Sporothrix bragantina TaxID=671064 RepID=A0ABP0CPI5_9PEZI
MKASVAGPVLAPRPAGLAGAATAPLSSSLSLSLPLASSDCLTHSDAEWTAVYPEIERLYVRERRKLRHVMQYMENRHNFKATVQMYKKRFAKWGFQKNTRRRPTGISSSQNMAVVHAHTPPSIATPPNFGPQDALSLLFFTSVRSWAGAFFDAPYAVQHQITAVGTPSHPAPAPAKAKEISFAFKLAMDLLERGHGDLAGRTARKAFLLVEDMLGSLAAPALVWNLLEIMHHMVSQNQIQLFQMLLAHVSALVAHDAEKDPANRRFGPGHPLPSLLHGLRGIAANTECVKEALAQAWTLNAEMLFDHFHPRMVNLYCLILWESCSIGPPAAIVSSVAQWFRTIDSVEVSQEHTKAQQWYHEHGQHPQHHPNHPSQQPTPPSSTDSSETGSPPPLLKFQLDSDEIAYTPYARLHTSCLAALRAHGDLIMKDGNVIFKGDPALLLRMLAGLTTAKILEGQPDTTSFVVQPASDGGDDGWNLVGMPRLHLSNVACVIRTLVEIDRAKQNMAPSRKNLCPSSTPPPSMVEQIRAVVELRSQADGRTDPLVMREMWLLQEALEAAGERDEAQEVERDAYARIDTYIQEIPVDAV